MSAPVADYLRRLATRSAVVTQHEAAMRAVADLLDDIDALHQPIESETFGGVTYHLDCADCGQTWPCPTARLLHPENVGA